MFNSVLSTMKVDCSLCHLKVSLTLYDRMIIQLLWSGIKVDVDIVDTPSSKWASNPRVQVQIEENKSSIQSLLYSHFPV